MRVIDDGHEGLMTIALANDDESVECFNCNRLAERLEVYHGEEVAICEHCYDRDFMPNDDDGEISRIDEGCDDYEDENRAYVRDGLAACRAQL